MNKKRLESLRKSEILTWCFLWVFLTAGIGIIFTSVNSRSLWYYAIKPAIAPPNWVFGIVWTVLFALIAVSMYKSWINSSEKQKRKVAWLFGINLVLNMAWPFFFFFLRNPLWAFYEIILVWISILILIIGIWKISKTSATLLIPYLVWVSFAALINLLAI